MGGGVGLLPWTDRGTTSAPECVSGCALSLQVDELTKEKQIKILTTTDGQLGGISILSISNNSSNPLGIIIILTKTQKHLSNNSLNSLGIFPNLVNTESARVYLRARRGLRIALRRPCPTRAREVPSALIESFLGASRKFSVDRNPLVR